MWLIHKPNTRGRVAPEGEGLYIEQPHPDWAYYKCYIAIARWLLWLFLGYVMRHQAFMSLHTSQFA